MDKQKKQMLMMGVLLLVLVAVGAFQFMGPKPAPATTVVVENAEGTTGADGTATTGVTIDGEKSTEVAANDPNTAALQADPLVANQLPTRDPFMPTSAAEKAAQENAQAGQKTAQPVNPPQATQQPRTGLANGNGYTGVGQMTPPYVPIEGNPGQLGLPPVGTGGSMPTGAGGTQLEPAKRTGYKVVGTIVGKQKMVILEDPDGNQILVREGKKTPDGKARVVGVQKGKAKVSQEGQVKMLGLEEE